MKEKTVLRQLRPALAILGGMTIVTGLVYPLAVTGVASVLFPEKAAGSLIVENGRVVGSSLIGQPFNDPGYFWGRLSTTSPYPYNAAASAGSNLGASHPALLEFAKLRLDALRRADPGNTRPPPVDLVTASASGLDPHISRAAALYQANRVARARGVDEATVRELIARHTEPRMLGVWAEPVVHVLRLNLALDALAAEGGKGRP